jgi:hypothetical protein
VIFVDKAKVGEDTLALWDQAGVERRDYGAEVVGQYVKEAVSSFRRDDEKKQVKVFGPKECSWALARTSSVSALSWAPGSDDGRSTSKSFLVLSTPLKQ